MHDILESTANQLRVAKRLAPRRGASLGERFGRLDDRFVFVLGSPRSGTTFLAGAIGSLPGFVDLGEVAPVKAAIPELAALEPAVAAPRLQRILAVARRVGLVGSVRPVEQTPEMAFLVRSVPIAYPDAMVVHIVRDGRDVVCSLLEKPWLRREQQRTRRRRPAVRLVRAVLGRARPARGVRARERRSPGRLGVAELRDGGALGRRAARRDPVRGARLRSGRRRGRARGALDVAPEPLSHALGRAHRTSVGRYRTDLDEAQLADVEAEAGPPPRRARLRQMISARDWRTMARCA